jgi:hypothetical protein
MRLPLFVSVRPKIGLESPLVLLGAGTWKLDSNGTSKFLLQGEEQDTIDIIEPTRVSVFINYVGTENSLTLYISNGDP